MRYIGIIGGCYIERCGKFGVCVRVVYSGIGKCFVWCWEIGWVFVI